MSRRSQRFRAEHGYVFDYVDGQVRLECPARHVVGYLMQFDNPVRTTLVLDKHRKGCEITGREPLRFTCDRCLHDGKRLNLLLSVERAYEEAEAARRDRTREVHVHVLGG